LNHWLCKVHKRLLCAFCLGLPAFASACEEPRFPIPQSLLLGNIHSTEYSAVIQQLSVKRVGQFGGPPKSTGYVNLIYQAKVIEVLKGKSAQMIEYAVMADADYKPKVRSVPSIVSLCKNEKRFYTPGNGYDVGFDAARLQAARAAGLEKAKDSVCR